MVVYTDNQGYRHGHVSRVKMTEVERDSITHIEQLANGMYENEIKCMGINSYDTLIVHTIPQSQAEL